ncbi:phosphatase PAP2 family protein [Cryobacterium sp. PH31-L1]|uniref:phosphatase PAP2 family protein n=1 Tax=Cryobacterium sp. PH31-L1 TaxID=3046199 RepID=UPI0024BBC0DD|nr:phosphatase PAP2 family protein [Cryobacterium sp. PH31-L1]MDJ0378217.1 phosphatase PAP2 family protein [Cryobacterium sp. PH31-L1]
MSELRSEPVWRTRYEKFVADTRALSAAQRRRLSLISMTLVGVGVVLFICVLVDVLQPDRSAIYDSPIRLWLVGERSPTLTVVMIALAIVFGPVALPIIVLVLAVVWGVTGKHAWRPLVLAAAMLTGVLLAQILAPLVARSRPPVELMLFGADHSFSFPSGHVLGAADFVLVLTYLIVSRRSSRRNVIVGFSVALVCIVLAATSRLYLGYHWTTDALASLAISFVVLGAVIAWDTRHAHRSLQARTLRTTSLQPGAAGPNKAVGTVTDEAKTDQNQRDRAVGQGGE